MCMPCDCEKTHLGRHQRGLYSAALLSVQLLGCGTQIVSAPQVPPSALAVLHERIAAAAAAGPVSAEFTTHSCAVGLVVGAADEKVGVKVIGAFCPRRDLIVLCEGDDCDRRRRNLRRCVDLKRRSNHRQH